MDAEQVLITTTLKFKGRVYDKGSILSAPLPPEIITELRLGSGLITVLKRTEPKPEPKPKPIPIVLPEVVKEIPIPKPKPGRRKKVK